MAGASRQHQLGILAGRDADQFLVADGSAITCLQRHAVDFDLALGRHDNSPWRLASAKRYSTLSPAFSVAPSTRAWARIRQGAFIAGDTAGPA